MKIKNLDKDIRDVQMRRTVDVVLGIGNQVSDVSVPGPSLIAISDGRSK